MAASPLLPRSARTGIGWPAIPSYRDAAGLALARQLEDSEWWAADRLLAHQLRQLEIVLAHAGASVPFYRSRFDTIGPLKPGELTLEAWRKIPVLTRRDIRSAGEGLVSRAIPKDHLPTHEHSTTGSTGRPVVILSTPVTGLFYLAIHLRKYRWHRRDLDATQVKIKILTDSEAARVKDGTPLSWVPVYNRGRMHLVDARTPITEQLRALVETQPAYLVTYPTNLRELLRRSATTGPRIETIREVATFGETVDPALRAMCQEIWGATLVDSYSSEEFGMVAVQCPDHPHYHVQSESVFVEVLDDRDQPCAPGTIGRLVITDLHNFAKPFIRYAVGDHAEVGEACLCGRHLPVLTRILGRTRNMLTLPSGDRVWPSLTATVELGLMPIRQIQIVQHSLTDVEVRLAVDGIPAADAEAALRMALSERFGHPFPFRFSYLDEIPSGPAGKYEDVISMLSPG